MIFFAGTKLAPTSEKCIIQHNRSYQWHKYMLIRQTHMKHWQYSLLQYIHFFLMVLCSLLSLNDMMIWSWVRVDLLSYLSFLLFKWHNLCLHSISIITKPATRNKNTSDNGVLHPKVVDFVDSLFQFSSRGVGKHQFIDASWFFL